MVYGMLDDLGFPGPRGATKLCEYTGIRDQRGWCIYDCGGIEVRVPPLGGYKCKKFDELWIPFQ